MVKHNSLLAAAAKNAGVAGSLDYAIFQNHGYMGLYGGLDAKGIHKKKSLKKSQHILDHMGSTELAANLFRATQTEEKLRRENIKARLPGRGNRKQTKSTMKLARKYARQLKTLVAPCLKAYL